jgi:uncharacterized membrane protein YdjX (TVP38/TMEM64 family)
MASREQKLSLLILLRLITTTIIATVLYSSDIATGSRTGKMVICAVLGLLLTAVFAEKYITKIANKLLR